jgi:dissimilatory sulfite reductase (desulfoviridin) alpha/beta subunit
MAYTIKPEDVKRVKALGFLNNKGTDLFNGRVITVNGKITADQAAVVAEAAKKFGNGDVEFTTRLTIEVRGIHYDNIEAFREYIAQVGLETGGTGSLVRPIVSCKGTTCQYGLYDTFAL